MHGLWSTFLFIVGAHASPLLSNLVLHESRSSAPDGFTRLSPAPAEQIINLRIALANSNITGLEQMLYAVSTPSSPLYVQHLSKEEVEKYVRPTNETTSIVNQFLQMNNISAKTISPAGDWLAFSTPISQANALFGADYSVFKHEATGSQITRTLSYSIPAELQGHLELVHPSISFDVPVNQSPTDVTRLSSSSQNTTASSRIGTRQSVPSSCEFEVTPSCLQALYSIPTEPATQFRNRVAVVGLPNEMASVIDLETYVSTFRPDIVGLPPLESVSIDGGTISSTVTPSLNTNAYTQIVAGLASKVFIDIVTVGSEVDDGPARILSFRIFATLSNSAYQLDGLLDLASFYLEQGSPPQVLSHSYSQDEDTISSALATQLCNVFMQLGARGVSVLVMSGNGGVTGSGQQTTECTLFVPTFPASCPFVTSIGSTFGIPESASPLSSGGFSNIFAQPTYQSSAVQGYFSDIGLGDGDAFDPSGRFNQEGRGYPDVSAFSENFGFIWEGDIFTMSGNALATPVFASVIALLNDGLINQGKPPMGFLNPFFYSAAPQVKIFNDIATSNNNPGCDSSGFIAVPGWDPITGFGTPDFSSLHVIVRS